MVALSLRALGADPHCVKELVCRRYFDVRLRHVLFNLHSLDADVDFLVERVDIPDLLDNVLPGLVPVAAEVAPLFA